MRSHLDAPIREFSVRAIILGMILGVVFGVGNAYLGLKIGTTVSASIPAAVLSMAILRAFFNKPTILENNLVQTIASVGEGLAAGIIFTVPALFILGEPPSLVRIGSLSALGGILGILFMIPMRRYLIVQEHEKFPFPEGTACAEILKSGERRGKGAQAAMMGILAGTLYKIGGAGLHLWKEIPSWVIVRLNHISFSVDATPALLGVGYIVGIRMGSILCAGGAFGWWVLIPLIKMFAISTTPIYPGTLPVAQMSTTDIWSNYIRYIGAGCVAIGGIMSLCTIAPLIWKTIHTTFTELFQPTSVENLPRTERDISMRWLLLGSVAIILTLWLTPTLSMNLVTIGLLAILGFFFVAVVSLTVGIVGSTSSPVSGMTIATLLITCVVFISLGWTERVYLISALTMAIVVNVAICLASTTSQDLKTGYLVGATPFWQQIGEMIGIVLPACAVSGAIYLLHTAYGFGSTALPSPQGTMMALIAEGVMEGNIPFTLVSIGIVIAFLLQLMQIPILPFAIGLYLPLSVTTPILFGGAVSSFVAWRTQEKEVLDKGILASSGLIAGDACTGVIVALLTVIGGINLKSPSLLGDGATLTLFILMGCGLAAFTLYRTKQKS